MSRYRDVAVPPKCRVPNHRQSLNNGSVKPATVIDRDAPYRDAFIPDNASRLWRYQVCAARALGVMALTTLVCWFMRPWLTPEACCMVFLGVTVSLGAIMAPPTPLFLALFGLLAWNYFFTPPDFDLRIRTTDELVHHLLFFVIALVMNGLTARLRLRERESKRRELRANLLRECREALVREDVAGFLRLIGNFVGGGVSLGNGSPPAARDDTLVTPLFAGGANLGALQIVFPQKPTPTEEGTWLLGRTRLAGGALPGLPGAPPARRRGGKGPRDGPLRTSRPGAAGQRDA